MNCRPPCKYFFDDEVFALLSHPSLVGHCTVHELGLMCTSAFGQGFVSRNILLVGFEITIKGGFEDGRVLAALASEGIVVHYVFLLITAAYNSRHFLFASCAAGRVQGVGVNWDFKFGNFIGVEVFDLQLKQVVFVF